MREDVEIDAGDVTLRGWLYRPDEGDGPFPAVVLAHGFSATKEMGLDRYGEVFAAAGLASVVYDHRNLGASDGEPRGEIDWLAQMRDYRRVVDFAAARAEIDAERIGIWGTSYSGGLVLIVAAIDRRVKCVVSQVPFVSGFDNMMRVTSPEERAAFFERIAGERRSLLAGNPPAYVPICVDDPTKPLEAPGRRTFRYFDHYRKRGVAWENRVTLRSLDWRLEYEALPFAARIAPTPLLMIVADDDDVTPPEIALEAFVRAGEPKKLVRIAGHHYRPYLEAFDESSAAARDWFALHLGARASSTAERSWPAPSGVTLEVTERRRGLRPVPSVTDTIHGVDGCRGGWISAMLDGATGEIRVAFYPHLEQLVAEAPAIVAIDVPIGLVDAGARLCDEEARRRLGRGRGSSVFPAPIRCALEASSYAEACAASREAHGKALSLQSWSIVDRIREADALIRPNVSLQRVFREVHPEMCFHALAGDRPIVHSKKTRAGRDERLALLPADLRENAELAISRRARLRCAPDDVLDAFAALWTARRIARSEASSIPVDPPCDRFGLRMEIVV